MPASLRPNLFATVTLAGAVSLTGCIFPFTRSNDRQLEEVVAAPSPASAPASAEVAATPKPTGEKQLPPFARFLGGMFGGKEGSAASADVPATEVEMPAARMAQQNPRPAAPTTSAEIKSAAELMQSPAQAPPQVVTAPSQAPSNDMPVVVTPETNAIENKPDVVSRFSQKASQMLEKPTTEIVQSLPKPEPQPEPKQEAASQAEVASQLPTNVAGDRLDEHAKTPWAERSLLNKAIANNSEKTTTLEHSLELALDSVRRERLEQQIPEPQPAASSTASTKEATAARSMPATSLEPPTQAETPTAKMASNPLRSVGGKTDWSGRKTPIAAPQTITNNMTAQTPEAGSQWTDPTSAAPQVAAKPEPPVEPQITENPYASKPESQVAAVSPTAESGRPTTTDEIHFQTSVLGKLQAANSQANWDFDVPTLEAPARQELAAAPAEVKSDIPQIVESPKSEPIPQEVAAMEPPSSISEPAVEPKTTINPSVAQTEPEAASDPIKPFIISEPARAPTRAAVVRAAEPAPLVIENQNGNWQNASATPIKKIPQLPPVVRASESNQPSAPRGSKTYIVN